MSFYGGNQNGSQPGSAQQQQMGRQPGGPGLQNVQQVLTPQLFNINVNPNQLHTFFNEHNSSQNQLQLNAAAANAPPILLQSQQTQSFPVNLLNEQLSVGVGQLISPAVSQNQMQGLPISMSSAINFSQALQVHAQTPPPQQAMQQQAQAPNQQSKQRVFTGTVTKIHDNFGFIDEEVFFQMGVVKGPILPKEGDRVLVEADFNASMPFKWNATRVQIVNIGGSLNSSLNNMSNLNTSQQQHMAFNTSVAMQKQSSAPPPPTLTSHSSTRPHTAQPVTIVSNPHSVYGGGTGTRGRTTGPAVPPTNPMVPAPRDNNCKRPIPPINMPMVSDPANFISNSALPPIMSSDRDLDRARDNDRSRDRGRERSPEHTRARERSRERTRPRSRERSRDRGRDRSRERLVRRSRSRERLPRDRSRDRGLPGVSRDRSRDRNLRDRSIDRSHPTPMGSRVREKSRDRERRERSTERVKRERTPEKAQERLREKQRDKESTKDKNNRKRSASPTPSVRSSKDDPKKDAKTKDKEKDTKQVAEKGRTTRDRSPAGSQANSQSNDRSKRSRSKESVRTDKGHTAEKSRSRSSSPRRKPVSRSAPRYAVEIPKFSLDVKEINVKEIQRRYPNLYVPSDFFLARSVWMDTFPLHKSFELGHSCPVHIMRKGIQKIEISDIESLSERFKDVPDILEPEDASNIFKAKVMIPSMSSLETIFRKTCGVTDDETDTPDAHQHIDRLINFIVGVKTAKHEVMALGGPWSPSIDGANPQSDPQTLINTAIRCVRALSGVNLSHCKHWYRFMELYYKRSNCLETVVFYLPDVWSCLPGTKEWNKLKSVYKYAMYGPQPDPMEVGGDVKDIATTGEGDVVPTTKAADTTPDGIPAEAAAASTVVDSADKGVTDESSVAAESAVEYQEDALNGSGLLVIDEAAASPVREEGAMEDARTNKGDQGTTVDGSGANTERMEVSHTDDPSSNIESDQTRNNEEKRTDNCSNSLGLSASAQDSVSDVEMRVVAREGENAKKPTHFSLLAPKNMNVAQLKEELNRRNLSPKGLKAQLSSRLVKALKEEESEEAEKTIDKANAAQAESSEEITSEHGPTNGDSPATETVIGVACVDSEGVEIANGQNEEEDPEDEHCIRLVNPSLILESQDDDISVEDGELKEDPDSGEAAVSQNETEYERLLANFPPDTFPIIKPTMKEEEVKMWERRYNLPKNPRLVIHPSGTAKSGNFDCLSMTIGLLRDYRIIDKKEEGFEVSLFSEFFHEMLQRDFAFRIYREIISEAEKGGSDDTASSEKNVEKDEKSKKDAGEPATKKRKVSVGETDKTVVETRKTTDPYLLLSFAFFDVTRCGYITETDLEDLCSCIGIGLTRSQIRKTVQKVVHKGTLYYRKWTDKPGKTKRSRSDSEEVRLLAQGNKAYFPVFVLCEDSTLAAITANVAGENKDDSEAVIAVVDGKNVDVTKLIEQLEKHEKDLSVAESSLNVMKNSLSESKSQVSELKKANETLKEEITKTKESLKKSETSEKSSKESVEIFKRSTERFIERVKDLVRLPSTSTKDKPEGSKDSVKSKNKSNPEAKETVKSIESDENSQSTQKDVPSGKHDERTTEK